MSGKYEEALNVARSQVEDGAMVLDLNFDDGLLDGEAAMSKFCKLLAVDPDIARVPVMLDSSRFEVILAGLKWLQGKSIVNSLSLKNGEAALIRNAKLVRRFGAAVVVMAFDEEGQATSLQRRIDICERAYALLTGPKVRFPHQDIFFDLNVLTIATGIPEHNNYAVEFLKAMTHLKQSCPGVRFSGG
eukprot:Filipodium_phascolosomae@DN8119_c0_g1_i1.p1